MPQFNPGEAKIAIAPITVSPAGLNCQAEIFLGPDVMTKVATSGMIPFVSTGAEQSIRLPVTMPTSEGVFHVFLDVSAEGLLIGAYQAIEDVEIGVAPVVGWVSPTGHIDPSGVWWRQERAYDDDINTFASTLYGANYEPIELTLDLPIECNKVGIAADSYGRQPFDYCAANVRIDIYYEGAYHSIHSGLLGPDYDGWPARKLWVEKPIPAGIKVVSKARIKWNVAYLGIYFWEFAFWRC